jgi:hypothetical protein
MARREQLDAASLLVGQHLSSHVVAYPIGDLLFRHTAAGDREPHAHLFRGVRLKIASVQRQQHKGHYVRHALVAVDERVVLCDGYGVGRCERREIRFGGKSECIFWPSKC